MSSFLRKGNVGGVSDREVSAEFGICVLSAGLLFSGDQIAVL